MSGRKKVLWAVAISAALITAGFILSCGDENGNDNGGVEVSCQDVCEKFEECEFIPGFFGEDVDDCEEACEDELAGDGGELAEAFQCVVDTDCIDVGGDCFCPTVCEKLDDCDLFEFWGLDNMAQCVFYCAVGMSEDVAMCYFGFSSCWLIWTYCYFPMPG